MTSSRLICVGWSNGRFSRIQPVRPQRWMTSECGRGWSRAWFGWVQFMCVCMCVCVCVRALMLRWMIAAALHWTSARDPRTCFRSFVMVETCDIRESFETLYLGQTFARFFDSLVCRPNVLSQFRIWTQTKFHHLLNPALHWTEVEVRGVFFPTMPFRYMQRLAQRQFRAVTNRWTSARSIARWNRWDMNWLSGRVGPGRKLLAVNRYKSNQKSVSWRQTDLTANSCHSRKRASHAKMKCYSWRRSFMGKLQRSRWTVKWPQTCMRFS